MRIRARVFVGETAKLPLLYALFFISGGSGLIFEILWIRSLGLHFGTTTPAISTVLAAFMAGLALGNLLFGRRADRAEKPLRLYQGLEIGIGITGLAVSFFLLNDQGVFIWLARRVADLETLGTSLRFLVFFGLLLLPTTLMGGTLPVISRALVREGAPGKVVGGLYAINTAGAVVGVLIPDLFAIPAFGMLATAGIASLGNLVVALGVGRLEHSSSTPPPNAANGRAPFLPLLLYTVSGFCSMAYEVIWSRVLQHWGSNRISTFSVLLAVFLVFLALGSWVAAKFADRVRDPLVVAAVLLVASAPCALLPIIGADAAPALFHDWLSPFGTGMRRVSPSYDFFFALLTSAYLEGAACFLFGAALPFLASASVTMKAAGSVTGSLYAANTMAGVVGSLAVGFFLLPALGSQGTMIAVAVLAACVGVTVLVIKAGALRPVTLVTGSVALAALVAGVSLPRDHLRTAFFGGAQIERINEGPTTTAALSIRRFHGEEAYRELLTPGVLMSDTRLGSRRYMGLMGHLPLLFSADGSEALVICYGTGNTARSLLSYQALRHLDVVDISREVLSFAGDFSSPHGTSPLEDERVEVHIDDGRQFLQTSGRRYDVITLEPPPPTSAGVVNLYSREFYRAAKGAMRPGGVLAQWLPVFQLSSEESLSIIASFTAEFASTALFYAYGWQWVLLGSDRPLRIDLDLWQQRLGHSEIMADLESIGVQGLPDLLASFMQDDTGLRLMSESAEPVTDNHPSIQYSRRGLRHVEPPVGALAPRTKVFDLIDGVEQLMADHELFRSTRRAFAAADIVHTAMPEARIGPPEARELVYGSLVFSAIYYQPGSLHLLALVRVGPDRVIPAQRSIDRGHVEPEALMTLARHAFYLRHWEEALTLFRRIPSEDVHEPTYWMLRGGVERALGHIQAATVSFENSARETDSEPFAALLRRLSRGASQPYLEVAGPLELPDEQ